MSVVLFWALALSLFLIAGEIGRDDSRGSRYTRADLSAENRRNPLADSRRY